MITNLSKSLQILADKVIYAESTLSEYYSIGCIKVRFSDHMSNDPDCDLAIFAGKGADRHYVYTVIPMIGTFKEVQWFTNVDAVIEFILRFESIARLLVKPPTHNDNQAERQMANAAIKEEEKTLTNETADNVSRGVWAQKLSGMYATKKLEVRMLLDEIYKIKPTTKVLKDMQLCSSYKNEQKIKYLAIYLENLKAGK